MRRRAGKGQGTEDSNAESVPLQIAGISSEAGDARDASNELEPDAGPLQLVGGAEGTTEERIADPGSSENPANAAAGSVNLPVNPFWSQRMQDEARLAAARPAHLDETASDSTEMRQLEDSSFAAPKSSPVSFGPPCGDTGDNLGVAAASTSVGNDQPPGLRPGERIILTEMKGLMETIMKQNAELSVQNAGLRQRIDKLEEEKASSQQAIRDELLATRSLHCVGLLFQILKVFAPGGMQERAQVLTELTNLGSAKSAADIVSALRAWSRCHARAVSMGVMIPDPALILRGVDALVDPLSRKASNAQVAFRLSTARNQLEIDHRPNMTSVIEYMRVLQSEWEQVSVSGLECNSAGQPKVARVDTTQGNGGKDGDKGGKGPKGGNQKGEKDGQTNNNSNTEGPPAKEEWNSARPITVEMAVGNCPVVSESLCLELIKELETFQNDRMLQQALVLRALNLGAESESLDLMNCVWGTESELLEWLRGSFGDWPEHLVRRALPARCDEAPAGSHAFMSMNRRHRRAVDRADDVILHLFAGGEKGLQVEGLGTKTVILRVDERVRRDLLDEKTYMWLATLCSSGKVSAVVANPPSSTFKHVWANDGVEKGFKGLRGSTGEMRFGLGENSVEEQMSVDDQTVLLLRTLTLHHLAHLARDGGCMVVLQHPDRADDGDPGGADLERREPGWWLWPEFSSSKLGWYRAAFGVSTGRLNERSCAKAISTNSWVLYTMLHARTELYEIHDDPRLTWQPSVLKAVGRAISVWKKETARDRDEREKEEEAAIKVLSKEELEFREHCEKDHIVFRKDCKVCLQAAMRGPKHIRQKYQHSNALCLNLDLIGPWIKGKDHILSAPARHILVATLGVPVFRDGKPLPLVPEKEQKEEEKEEKKEESREEREGCENLGSEEDIGGYPEAGGIGEWILEDEDAGEKEEEETALSEEEYKRSAGGGDEMIVTANHDADSGESYTLQQSEAAAAELLVRSNQIEREDLDAKGLTLGSYAYGTKEVLRNIDDWKGAISDELGNVFDVHQAMRRRRSSIVKVEAAVTNAELCHLRAAGHRAVTNQWRTSGADIRTAFLLAPLRQQSKRIFLRPPSVLKQAGFAAEGEFWEITGALYGLQDSPADWAMYRDETLPTIEIVYRERTTYLTRSKYEPNMWLLYCPFTSELLAALTIYVDDLLLSGTAEASEAIWTAIKGKWKISEPDYADEGHAITFCGFEIEQKTDGIHVGQSKYIQSLLEKYPEIQGTVGCPYAKENDNNDCKPQDSIEKLRKAQAIVGEMLWVATRTRLDLVFGVSRIGQLITRDVDQAIQRGEDMIRYLRATKHQELVYGMPGIGHGPGDQLPVERNFNLIEVFADASFCPGTDRSQTGIILMWGNAPVGWMSMRQPCASLSTAEAELHASLDGMTLAEGLHGLLTELAEAPQQSFLYNDNIGACTVMTLPQGAWRTRHLRLKAAWFLEQLELSRFRIYHVPGRFMLGDLCTKSLQGVRVRELLQMMSVQLGPSNVDGGESHAIKKAAAGAEVSFGSGGVTSGGAEKALKALTAASLLHGVMSKLVTVQVDIEPEEKHWFDYNNNLLKLACGALLLVALTAFATWKYVKHVDPRRSLEGERLLGGGLGAFSASGDAGLSEGDDDLPPGDEQEDTAAELQSALEFKAAARPIPVIYPGWYLRTPPQETWDPEPAWGGPESNFHQSIPPRVKKDFWHVDRRRSVAVRFHAQPRVKLYLPGPSGLPEGVQYAQLTGRRRTLAKFSEPVDFKIVSDEWNTADRPTRQLERRWTGRTEFELQGPRAE
ncbi:Copia protein [Symbiodinium microadriaticum]|uniref:Copia protein n=1 Tax=Symbiodinium microadriaticum TaxID=2951 RepID=A0A1Q9ECU7_SYMMI|nr:Copia protein [Symbiodinium microadriaticum]